MRTLTLVKRLEGAVYRAAKAVEPDFFIACPQPHDVLQISTCEGAHKMERLMVMIHRHSDLLPKFQGELARRWHTYKEECSNQFR